MISLKVGSLTALSSKLGLRRADPAKPEQARPEPQKARAASPPARAVQRTRAAPSAFRPKLVLASASPRRLALLEQVGIRATRSRRPAPPGVTWSKYRRATMSREWRGRRGRAAGQAAGPARRAAPARR